MKKDSKLKSLSEALTNIVVGYPINHVANIIILVPFAPILTKQIENTGALSAEFNGLIFIMGMFYTVVSVLRQYLFRRLFERYGHNENAYTLILRLFKFVKHKYGI